MTIVEKLFALKQYPLFRILTDSELILIAELAVARSFAAGARIAGEKTVLNRLIIVGGGGVVREETGEAEFPVIGIECLAGGDPVTGALVAGPDGAECLMISKGHFFTIINECPDILTRYLQKA